MLQITCEKTVFRRQARKDPAYLSENGEPDPKLNGNEKIREIFSAGRKYPITNVTVEKNACSNTNIAISARGNDGEDYIIIKAVDVSLENHRLSDQFSFQ